MNKQTSEICLYNNDCYRVLQGEFLKSDWMEWWEGFREEMLFELRPEWQEGGNCVKIWGFQAKGTERTKTLRQG